MIGLGSDKKWVRIAVTAPFHKIVFHFPRCLFYAITTRKVIEPNLCSQFGQLLGLSKCFYWTGIFTLHLMQSMKTVIFYALSIRMENSRVRKTPSARQQCWPESFCESGKFLQQAHYLLKNFRIFWKMSGYYTKYPDNMQSRDELEIFHMM